MNPIPARSLVLLILGTFVVVSGNVVLSNDSTASVNEKTEKWTRDCSTLVMQECLYFLRRGDPKSLKSSLEMQSSLRVLLYLELGQKAYRVQQRLPKEIASLVGFQANSGRFGDTVQVHSLATLALARAHQRLNVEERNSALCETSFDRTILSSALNKAVDFLLETQSKQNSGWSFWHSDRKGNTLASAQALLSLLAARDADIPVPDQSIASATEFLLLSIAKEGFVPEGGFGFTKNAPERSAVILNALARAGAQGSEEYKTMREKLYLNIGLVRIRSSEACASLSEFLYTTDRSRWDKWNLKLTENLLQLQESSGGFNSAPTRLLGTGYLGLALAPNLRGSSL